MNKHNKRVHNENKSLLLEMRNYCTNEHNEGCLNLLIWVCGLEACQEIACSLLHRLISTLSQRQVAAHTFRGSVSVAACSCVTCNSTLFLCTSWGLPIEISLFFH